MRLKTTLVAFGFLSLPLTAFASSEAEGGGLGNLISVAPGSMLWTILTFLLLLIVLWKYAWGPIIKGLEAREDKIRSAIEDAQKDREKAAELLSDYEAKLKTTSAEIADRLATADKEAAARIEQAKEQAREEGEKMIARAKQEIEAQKEKVSSELRREVADLATSVASAAIGESFDKDDQLRIIKRRLEQVENPS